MDISGTNQFGGVLSTTNNPQAHRQQDDQATIRNLRQRLAMIDQSSTNQVEALKHQLLSIQQNNGIQGTSEIADDLMSGTMIVKPDCEGGQAQEIIHLLKVEN